MARPVVKEIVIGVVVVVGVCKEFVMAVEEQVPDSGRSAMGIGDCVLERAGDRHASALGIEVRVFGGVGLSLTVARPADDFPGCGDHERVGRGTS